MSSLKECRRCGDTKMGRQVYSCNKCGTIYCRNCSSNEFCPNCRNESLYLAKLVGTVRSDEYGYDPS